MFVKYSKYKVEVTDSKFVTDEGIEYANTAIVTYIADEKHNKHVNQFGYIEQEEIFKKIDNKEIINLNQCYVNKLSLFDYRQKKGMDKTDFIEIKGLTAQKAFFDSLQAIDFSYTRFEDGDILFNNSIFVNGDLSFRGSNFNHGNINFAYAKFNCEVIDFSNTLFGDGEINFKNSLFTKGYKNFQYANFGNGDVNFINAEFNDGDVCFINCVFHDGDILFKVARFGTGKIDFRFAKFGKGNFSFEKAEFGDGGVDFRNIEFNRAKVNFNRAQFGQGQISFDGCEITEGKFYFRKVKIEGGGFEFSNVDFKDAEVFFDESFFGDGKISYFNSKFRKLSLKSCNLDNYIDLRASYCYELDMSDAVIYNIIDLKPFDFKIDINKFNITGIRLLGRIYLDWNKNEVKKIIYNQVDNTYSNKAEQFLTLKQNFNTIGYYNDEDFAYVEFKRMEAEDIFERDKEKKGLDTVKGFVNYWFKKIVFDYIGLFATSPIRVLSSVIFIWFIFGVIYFLCHLSGFGDTVSGVGNPDHLSVLVQSFYHSAITFFTIGYGDVYPVGLSRLFSAFEGFMGVFMMSYFTVAFVRKILR
jgi:hypothetical protein